MNRRRMMMLMTQVAAKLGLYKPDKCTSSFDFGITWSEIDKVVVVADKQLK